MCGSIEQQHHLWQPGLAFYGSGLACLPSLLGMVNAGWLCSIRPKIFLQIKFIILQGCSTKLHFYFKMTFFYLYGSLVHIISSLFSHFIDHEITLNISKFILNSIEKVKPGFSFFSMCIFPESNGTKTWSHSFYLQNSGILQTRMDQRVTQENEFWQISNAKMRFLNS